MSTELNMTSVTYGADSSVADATLWFFAMRSAKVIPSLRDEVGLAPYRANGRTDQIYLHGGIRPYVLRQLLAGTTGF